MYEEIKDLDDASEDLKEVISTLVITVENHGAVPGIFIQQMADDLFELSKKLDNFICWHRFDTGCHEREIEQALASKA